MRDDWKIENTIEFQFCVVWWQLVSVWTFSFMYNHIILLCLHITRGDIKLQVKWTFSLVIADGQFNLPHGFRGMYWYSLHTHFYHPPGTKTQALKAYLPKFATYITGNRRERVTGSDGFKPQEDKAQVKLVWVREDTIATRYPCPGTSKVNTNAEDNSQGTVDPARQQTINGWTFPWGLVLQQSLQDLYHHRQADHSDPVSGSTRDPKTHPPAAMNSANIMFELVSFIDTLSQEGLYCFLCLQIARSDIRPQVKWAVSLVIADGHFNLLGGLCGYI